MKYCEECGLHITERHHIVFKSQGGLDFKLNYKDLCPYHHRGEESPHKNRKKDLQYKKVMQTKIEKILLKDYYTQEELIKILEMRKSQAKKAFKHLRRYKEGYCRNDIIMRLMGGRNYAEDSDTWGIA